PPMGITLMMLTGNARSFPGIVIALALFSLGIDHALALFGPMMLLGVGNGATLPSANAGIVSVRPHLAGSASGLGGALQLGLAAGLSTLAGILVTTQSGALALLGLMLACAFTAVAAVFVVVYSGQS